MSNSVKKSDNNTFGKNPLQSWIGIVAPFKVQEEQAKGLGWGWRYKVRIMGDHSDTDDIPDEDLDYAYVLLPTTAGSGGGGRIRTVRIVQGDMVYGIYGSGNSSGIRLILGVFPRTASIEYGKFGKFDPIKGWYGNIKPSPLTGDNEINDLGIATPNSAPILNKSNISSSEEQMESMGILIGTDGPKSNVIKERPRVPADQPWNGGSITRAQLNYIRTNSGDPNYTGYYAGAFSGIPTENEIRSRQIYDAETQAILQGLMEEIERTQKSN